ncbi:unnamed protein product [Nezara viridula]|uniref:Cadherin domain-containing protein n=1 Tax=Nezara viridula TaxID=85310 RepID=A0A9P0H7F8_NEZVI|nr:unnamed protein product [Nezara viridula]
MVREDAGVGFVVGNVVGSEGSQSASGRARAGHLMYSLSSIQPTEPDAAFDLDRGTGSLVVTRALDREQCSEYRLEVRALDTSTTINHQSSAVIVKVEVTDVNDNPPVWSKDVLHLELQEDVSVGTAVFNFVATDTDSSPNGDIHYTLIKSHPVEVFSVDALTGTLSVSKPLDYEEISEYTIVVRATDQALNESERLSSTITARIKIRDVNDNRPVFISPMVRSIFAKEGSELGDPLCQVMAVDRDSAEFGRVTYVLTSGNDEGRFNLNFETGLLSVAGSLDPAARSVLNITASDQGSPPLQGSMSLVIAVRGATESPPAFSSRYYSANVSEDASIGTFITRLQAKSPISGGSNGLIYTSSSDKFIVDPITGVVTLGGVLDRETVPHYDVAFYVAEGERYDTTILSVTVIDANDHAPRFPACYPLGVPENSDFGVIHRFQAHDRDTGANADITYTITGGNTGNRFSLDVHTGELSARPLDREAQSSYRLTVTASDGGSPPLSSSCNFSVRVQDENDNPPVFSEPSYRGRVREDAPLGSLVLNVSATDRDQGDNAKLSYSLANESQAFFRIDQNTGLIYTAGLFDREQQNIYHFQVVATDNGRYDARSEKVSVEVRVEDVNDNKPEFSRYPFTAQVPSYVPSGKELLKVTATDADEGTNSDIVFSFLNEPPNNKFRMDPKTGVVTATSSLAMENGRLYHLEVLATDRGNPPQSASGLIEIRVGEGPEGAPTLRFQNTSYAAYMQENSPVGTEVLQVSAVRSDGRRQQIRYSLVSGNEGRRFEINPSTGLIRVSSSSELDYEAGTPISLTVEATADSPFGSPLYGYTTVLVHLTDQNDNSPKFTQSIYSTTVWEGNNKGTFVMQVSATDLDTGPNSQLLYHIVDGNHDNAFIIEPPSSGIVKMNIVLDREIRDSYRLTVIATDEGVPQLTGTSTILINIVDINDNQPNFPPHSVITVNEGKEVGSVLTSITANDVDTNPALTYNLSDPEDGKFSIDRFSGRVTLCHQLDYESVKEYRLGITASDTAHTAHTILTVIVTDSNDNPPVFSQPNYHATLLSDVGDSLYTVLTVSATDEDSEKNNKITYSLVGNTPGFMIDDKTGALLLNRSAIIVPTTVPKVIDLTVMATDSGKPPLSSTAAVRISVGTGGSSKAAFSQREYRITAKEDTNIGTSLIKLSSQSTSELFWAQYSIIDGNSDHTFHVMGPNGDLVLVKPLDREQRDHYTLKVVQGADNSSAVSVYIAVEDVNDNPPQFHMVKDSVSIPEDVPIGHSIAHLKGNDNDLPPNSDIIFDILSGNDEDIFKIDPDSGIVKVKNKLDYDKGLSEYFLVLSATDCAKPPEHSLLAISHLKIILEDVNDNAPHFPVAEYLEFVGENEALGTKVFTARATDMDRGIFGHLNYSIETTSISSYNGADESWKLFRIDSVTGLVTTNTVFDYELRSRYAFTIMATDSGGRSSKVKVRIEIESRDEFYPQFTERTYRFVVSGNDLSVGYVIGTVVATDRDKGPDGRVVYQLTNQHAYFKVNRTTGAVMIKKKIDSNLNTKQDVSFVIRASSGRQESLTNMTVVEISFDPLAHHETNLIIPEEGSNNTALAAATGKVADWAIGLLISLIIVILCFGAVFLFLHVRNRRQKNVNKPGLDSGQTADNFVDPSAFDTIPVRGGIPGPASQFGPPKYEDLPTYRNNKSTSSQSGAATTSQISGSDQSGSSGRGSAEDGDDVEDEEIRMINEGIQRDGGLHRTSDDNMSDVSVHNTQEYLARLGIVNTDGNSGSRRRTESVGGGSSKDIMLRAGVPIDGLRMFDEDGTAEADITNLIYAKLTDGSDRGSNTEEGGAGVIGMSAYPTHQPSMTGSLSSIVHSEEELTGSYNWDYLLDWGPQYQPLAHVFSEIARLKEDAASVKSGTSGTSSGKGKPPLLTSVAPRSIAAPVLSGRPPHHPPHQGPKIHLLPRSPINHDNTGVLSAAMSPSFSPALSPLATSPSLSPIVTPRHPTSHHVRQRTTDAELRI